MDGRFEEAEPTEVVRVGEVDLAFGRFGRPDGRPPLLLLHGFSGSATDFALEIGPLSSRREVIVIDQRGHGRSTKLRTTDGYTIELLATDLAAFVDSVVGGPVHLLGHSMGGRVALELALAEPARIASLVCMDTSAGAFVAPESIEASIMVPFLDAYDPAGGLPDRTAMRGPEDDLIETRVPAALRARRDELWADFDPYAMKALGRELLGLGERSLLGRLGELRLPVTVLVGALDAALVEPSRAMAAAVVGAELVEIDGAYHSPQLTHETEWTEAVLAHLARAE